MKKCIEYILYIINVFFRKTTHYLILIMNINKVIIEALVQDILGAIFPKYVRELMFGLSFLLFKICQDKASLRQFQKMWGESSSEK